MEKKSQEELYQIAIRRWGKKNIGSFENYMMHSADSWELEELAQGWIISSHIFCDFGVFDDIGFVNGLDDLIEVIDWIDDLKGTSKRYRNIFENYHYVKKLGWINGIEYLAYKDKVEIDYELLDLIEDIIGQKESGVWIPITSKNNNKLKEKLKMEIKNNNIIRLQKSNKCFKGGVRICYMM